MWRKHHPYNHKCQKEEEDVGCGSDETEGVVGVTVFPRHCNSDGDGDSFVMRTCNVYLFEGDL